MPRKLPRCAWCGEPVAGSEYFQLTFEDVPGRPAVAWHTGDCKRDFVLIKYAKDVQHKAFHPDALLKTILGRGRDRVVANKEWRDYWSNVVARHQPTCDGALEL